MSSDKTLAIFLLPIIFYKCQKTVTNPRDNIKRFVHGCQIICNESFHFKEYQLIDCVTIFDSAPMFSKSKVKSPNIVANLICRVAISPAGAYRIHSFIHSWLFVFLLQSSSFCSSATLPEF